MKHYGIDPRKRDNVQLTHASTTTINGNYNPYKKNSKPSKSQKITYPKNATRSLSQNSFPKPSLENNSNSMTMASRIEKMNLIFDLFIQSIQDEPLHTCLERASRDIFGTQTANCWEIIINYDNFAYNLNTINASEDRNNEEYDNNAFIYSQHIAKQIEVKTTKSLLSQYFKTHIDKGSDQSNYIQKYSYPPSDPDFNTDYDYPFPTIHIPIFDEDDRLGYILQIVYNSKSEKEPFTPEEEKLANLFSIKLSMYSHLFCMSDTLNIMKNQTFKSGIHSISNRNEQILVSEIHHKLKNLFKCRTVEFWANDVFDTCCHKYNENAGKFIPVSRECGVVRELFEGNIDFISLPNVKDSLYYSAEYDGRNDESVMMHLIIIDGNNYAIVFRGKSKEKFSVTDERLIKYFVPILVNLFIDCHKKQNQLKKDADNDRNEDGSNLTSARLLDTDKNNEFAERLKALLEVAEIISGVLDIDILIPTIMERACSLLNTERCSLFLVDPVKQELITRFHGGLNRSIRIPLKKGIVGHTAVTGQIVNIKDAYSDERFDNHVDLATGFRTKTILTVPIYNNRGEIAGVTEMINKFDDGVFDEDDIKMLMAFNVFCGISLDNAKLYNSSLNLTRQLRSFVEMSNAMNNNKQIHNVLEQILSGAQEIINAARATIFMKEGDDLLPFVSIGDDVKYNTLFADEVMSNENHQPYIFTREEIFIRVQSLSDKPIDGFTATPLSASKNSSSAASTSSTKGLTRIASCLVHDDDNVFGNPADDLYSENICDIPLVSSEAKVLGVLELSSAGKIMPEDLKLLDCFAVFATVSIERSELQEIAKLGQSEVLIKQYLTMDERKENDIPSKMKLDIDTDVLLSINFDAVAYDGSGHFKVLWAIADYYGILKEFNINNDKFFRFMVEISQTYKKVPYHNWRHAVDVCQFTAYEVKLANLKNVFTKFELLGFLVSAICHDANHDGFTNTYNEKAETPLGILYKNQSVMETHHCTVAITVMSKEECNLFSNLNSDQFKNMWNLIFQLILITDMAKHFNFLKEISADLDKDGHYDMTKPENRLKVMQLILKCGDISNVSRPFELADKWCDVLCEEFFRQGDLEKANGMEYTSTNNDREHLDKPKSQIGFYTFVCLPLYQLAARVLPELQANVDQVQSNLAIWKAASEKGNENTES
ncbi:hypothetical protein M9Y10_033466 [Tritrichomonas musculus]|uniref:PDEase domain-containing protein n=1 Tax=Tritrichomonas musculus TaxID=1915356 RepID=A0ABR2KCX0_9EUKA